MRGRGSIAAVLATGLATWVCLCQTAVAGVAAQSSPVTWFVFFDDFHLQFRNTGRLRDLVRTIHRELVREGDTCVLRCSGPSCSADGTGAIAGCAGLAEDVRRLTGNGLREGDMLRGAVRPSSSDWSFTEVATELRSRAARALTTADVLLGDPSVAPGRAHLLFISNGYLNAAGVADRISALGDRAAALGVRVHPISSGWPEFDPTRSSTLTLEQYQALQAESRASLTALAERTGGLAVNNAIGNESLSKALAAIQARAR